MAKPTGKSGLMEMALLASMGACLESTTNETMHATVVC